MTKLQKYFADPDNYCRLTINSTFGPRIKATLSVRSERTDEEYSVVVEAETLTAVLEALEAAVK